jgi:hypothetical protein
LLTGGAPAAVVADTVAAAFNNANILMIGNFISTRYYGENDGTTLSIVVLQMIELGLLYRELECSILLHGTVVDII